MYFDRKNNLVHFVVVAPEYNPDRPGDQSWVPGAARIVITNARNKVLKSPFVDAVVFNGGQPVVNLSSWARAKKWRTLDEFYEGDPKGLRRFHEFLRRTVEEDWHGYRRFSLAEFLDGFSDPNSGFTSPPYAPPALLKLRALQTKPRQADPFAEPEEAADDEDLLPRDHALPPTTEATELAHKIATAATQRAAAEAAGMSWSKVVKRARELGIDAHAIQGTRAED